MPLPLELADLDGEYELLDGFGIVDLPTDLVDALFAKDGLSFIMSSWEGSSRTTDAFDPFMVFFLMLNSVVKC